MTFPTRKPAWNPARDISRKQWIAMALLIAAGVAGGAAILATERAKPADAHGHGHAQGHGDGEHHGEEAGSGHDHASEHADNEHHDETAKGSHGGQLLAEGDFALEVLLAEEGDQPVLRAWPYEKGQPVAPGNVKVAVTLTRPGGEPQQLTLAPAQDGSLASTAPVAEPHVFDAQIEVQTPREPYLFAWSRQEGKVAMTDAQVKAAGITVEPATAALIRSSLQLPGEIRFNEDRTAHVVPRVAGVVERVAADLGQRVRRGQVLAVISSPGVSEQRAELQAAQKRLQLARTTYEREKQLWEDKISPQQDVLEAQQALHEAEIAVTNAQQKLRAIGSAPTAGDLNRYELRAPFDGTVVAKHIALGEAVKEDSSVFTISDLSSVWAEINVPARDLGQVRVGERVNVRSTAAPETAAGTVAYVGSLLGEQTRTAIARVTLANPKGAWRPGLFVTVELVTAQAQAAVTVAADAIQQVDNRPVVFVQVPGGFVPQPVELGRSDGKRIEVVGGLKAGARHAAAGSFVVKSEAGKASATHTH